MALVDFQLCTMGFHYQNCGDKLTHIFEEVGYTETFYQKLVQGKNLKWHSARRINIQTCSDASNPNQDLKA